MLQSDHKQVHEAFARPQICNIDPPNLIWALDLQPAQQVGTDILGMDRLLRFGPG